MIQLTPQEWLYLNAKADEGLKLVKKGCKMIEEAAEAMQNEQDKKERTERGMYVQDCRDLQQQPGDNGPLSPPR